jgi:hypothetical protein
LLYQMSMQEKLRKSPTCDLKTIASRPGHL